MKQIVARLKDIITKTKVTTEIDQTESNLESLNKQQSNLKSIDTCSFPNSSLHGELSQTIENFPNMNTNEIEPTTVSNLESLNKQQSNLKSIDTCSFPNNSLHGELSQIIENFPNMNTNEIEPTTVSNQAAITSYKIKEKQSKF